MIQTSDIAVPAATVWVVDSYGGGCWYTQSSITAVPIVYSTAEYADRPVGCQNDTAHPRIPARHPNDEVNVLWCDGHVKPTTLGPLFGRHSVGGTNYLYNFTNQDD
jgi:prepilin-type processing-associated H-X9-DG protein